MRRKLLHVAAVVGIVLLIVLVASGIINSAQNHNLHKVGDKFVSALLAGDSQQSFDLFTPKTQLSNPLSSSWKPFVKNISASFYRRTPSLVDSYRVNSYTVLEYKISAADGSPYRFTVTLTPAGLNWKVVSFWSSQA